MNNSYSNNNKIQQRQLISKSLVKLSSLRMQLGTQDIRRCQEIEKHKQQLEALYKQTFDSIEEESLFTQLVRSRGKAIWSGSYTTFLGWGFGHIIKESKPWHPHVEIKLSPHAELMKYRKLNKKYPVEEAQV